MSKRISKALADPTLRRGFGVYVASLAEARTDAFRNLEWEKLQGRVADAKKRAMERLPELLSQFKEEAERSGAVVHFAETSEDANSIIAQIAAERQVQRIIKSRTFTAIETGLTRYLRQKGLEVTETDLSSWVLQLDGQRPSHLIFPALHLTREQIAETLSRVLGEPVDADVPRLAALVRNKLRDRILAAQMGITGANVAVAENGAMVILDNEGNTRLVTSLPSLHVVLMGVDKIVRRTEEAMTVLRVLTRCATGDKSASYATWIRGPVPYTEGGVSQRELHVVLLDNGRLRVRDDPWYNEIFQCIRCGACSNVCPAFKSVTGLVFGDDYPGPIGLVLAGLFKGLQQTQRLLDLCHQCGACREVCPGKINLPELILQLRQQRTEHLGLSWKKKIIHRGLVSRKRLFRIVTKTASYLQKPFMNQHQMIRHLPFLGKQARFRSLPGLSTKTFRDMWPQLSSRTVQKPLATAALFSGCGVNLFYPEIGEAVVRVLRATGVQVLFPTQQTCCGSPAHNDGDLKSLLRLAQQNLEALRSTEADFILTVCPACALALKDTYPGLLPDNENWQKLAGGIAEKVRDFSFFLVDLLNFVPEAVVRPEIDDEVITYHDPCHLARGLGIREQPRRLIRQIDGTELVEMKDSTVCCGFGKSFSFSYPELSGAILKEKMENIEATGAHIVLTDCPGCIFQIRGGLDRRGSRIETFHTAEFLAWKMGLLE